MQSKEIEINELAACLSNPKPIEDGFYAFVCVGGPSDQYQKIPGYSENQWYEQNLTPAVNGPDIDSTGWWYRDKDSEGLAYYAKIRPIQGLLDGDGHIGVKLKDWANEILRDAVKL